MLSYAHLSPFDEKGRVQMVVETPRGSSTKFKFDDAKGVFTVSRSLALGVTYPFDWGFVPGTRSGDGDALDALCVHPNVSFAGVVLPCRCIGAVRIDQKGNGGRVENPRVILRPHWQGTQALETDRGLTDQMRAEIEQFFLNATLFTEKDARIAGWLDDAAAENLIREASV
jgi:inorganic pyrophosphatase